MKLVLAGGRQGRAAASTDRSHRPLYDLAVLAELDTATLALRRVLTWRSLDPCDPDRVGHRFGAPSVDGESVLLCTEREVLRVRDADVVERWTHRWMGDLHHAAVLDGRLLAVATGADGVIERADPPTFHPVAPDARAPSADLRCVETRDRVHPNYVFSVADRVWVTRGTTGDALRLDDGRTVAVAAVCIHDGVPDGPTAWFTAVDGRLVQVDLGTGATVRTVDLHLDEDGPEPLGWCRGLALHEGIAWVGFTRIRTTRFRHHLAWAKGRLRGVPIATRRPTRIVGVELATGLRVASVDLAPVGIDALFGVSARTGS